MILVTGATGFIGRHVVAKLLDQNLPVRCLLPANRQRDLPWAVPEMVTGTALDEEALFAAVTGAHVIIHLENAQWWGRSRELERVEVIGTRNLISVARSARVGRIITLSQLGASPSSAFTLLRIKGEVEGLIRDSGLAYTIIRPGLVFGPDDAFINHIVMLLALNPFVFMMPGQGEIILHPIHVDDVAEAVVRSLALIDTVDRVIDIGGPEYIVMRDMIQTAMRVSGIYRTIVPLEPYVMRGLTRFWGVFLRRTLMSSQWMDILAASRTARLGNTYEFFGFHPRRFEDTLVTYLPKKRYFLPALRYMVRRRPRGF